MCNLILEYQENLLALYVHGNSMLFSSQFNKQVKEHATELETLNVYKVW